MDNIKYTLRTDIQEEYPIKDIETLLVALERLKNAQIEKNTTEGHIFLTVGVEPTLNNIAFMQASYYYNKNAGFFKKFLNQDEFVIEVIINEVEGLPTNNIIRRLHTANFETLKNIFVDFVEKQIVPNLSTWERE